MVPSGNIIIKTKRIPKEIAELLLFAVKKQTMYAEGLFASFGKERGRASWVSVSQCSQLSSLSFVGVSSRYIRNPKQVMSPNLAPF